ncbi:2-hydroxyacyl-CoA dehydratase [Clostridium sp. BNL1100]|uniref:2-hydroxyacyl-CoA dehydratase family protein n=1 Tax=Clostridium sp. BNL1100 TaxID=755731 RepID=UPI00024A7D93|nr:2-hydroxyacyl-CoA dehydratase [Clostridium sp. BNL1100]AEY64978.1 Benzoyl-CoA reductase/2-hydroxyglutaryl-CoA dehydratase subunit, BcrC/BadD/HgdB [Clostridium sp. BNL1100]
MRKIGITTTVPVEILLAANCKVIDLNNIFISGDSYSEDIERAERDGFPKSSCAWIKGIYGACLRYGISEVVGVQEGDCSNTGALLEVLKTRGIKVYPFSYPSTHNISDITLELNKFMSAFNVSRKQAETVRIALNSIRNRAKAIDELTYIDNKATGFENHISQVNLSDFNGNPQKCAEFLEAKISEITKRLPRKQVLRLGYIGVPPMICDVFEYVERFNACFVYNEVQREFSFPRASQAKNIYEQYYDYTYPYDLKFRLMEIKKQIRLRRLDGIIHYTQSFCHRAIQDIVIKQEIDIPVFTIEGDKSNCLDPRSKLRLEAFLDMLGDLRGLK